MNFINGGFEFSFNVGRNKPGYRLNMGFTTYTDYLPGEKGTLGITSSTDSYFKEKIYDLPDWRKGFGSIFNLPE